MNTEWLLSQGIYNAFCNMWYLIGVQLIRRKWGLEPYLSTLNDWREYYGHH